MRSCIGVITSEIWYKGSAVHADFELEALSSSARFDTELLMGETLPLMAHQIPSPHLRLS